MANDFDPQRIWQTGPEGEKKASLEEIRRKAQKLRTKSRLAAFYGIAAGIILCGFFAVTAARGGEVLPRVGLAVLSVWSLHMAWYAYKWIWPRDAMPGDTLGPALSFYRGALENQRDHQRRVWRRAGLSWCMAGLALIVLSGLIHAFNNPQLVLNIVPLLAVLGIWFVVYFVGRRRRLGKLQREIEELKALDTERR